MFAIYFASALQKNDHLHIVIYEYERLLSTEPGICIRYMPYIINDILFI